MPTIAGSGWNARAVRLLALLTLCPLGSGRAEGDAHDPDLRTLRAAFRQGFLLAILPERRAFAERLRAAETKLAELRNYPAAARARDERLAIEQQVTAYERELPSLAVRAAGRAALLPERISFAPKAATLLNLKLDKDGAIGGWGAGHGSATWKLPALPAGGYEINLRYACGGEAVVKIEVRESFHLLRGALDPTNGNAADHKLGTLRIRDGAGAITLASDGATPATNLRILALELTPANR